MNLFEGLAAASQVGDDGVNGGGPEEGFWVFVPGRQELLDGGF